MYAYFVTRIITSVHILYKPIHEILSRNPSVVKPELK